jgi:sugar (pentulose or hexulose) kinase
MEHHASDLIRAAYEGVAFSLRHLLDALCQDKTPPREIAIAQTADLEWAALRASAYGVPLWMRPGYDPTALGAALVGLVAYGTYPDLETAIRLRVQPGILVPSVPDPHLSTRYERYRMLSALATETMRMS